MRFHHFFSMPILALLLGLSAARAQNIPPMIGDRVGKPKIQFPNPMERVSQPSSQPNQNQALRNQEAELRGFAEAYAASFSAKNLEAVGRCYWQGPELLVYWQSEEFRGWEPVNQYLQKTLEGVGTRKLVLENPDVRVFGRLAWIAVACRLEEGEDSHQQRHGRITFILERQRTNWFIIHQHVSFSP